VVGGVRISSLVLERTPQHSLRIGEFRIDADGGLGILERPCKVFAPAQPPGIVDLLDRPSHGDGKVAAIDGYAILNHRIRLARNEVSIWVQFLAAELISIEIAMPAAEATEMRSLKFPLSGVVSPEVSAKCS